MKRIISLFSIVVLTSIQILASGFQINEHGAKAMGLAGAFTGLANDPSAVYFNPAGITQLMGTHFSAGATYITPSSTFTGPTPLTTESKLKDQFFTPINFYFTQELGSDFWVGFGLNNPFGLGTAWDEDWIGRYRTVETEIRMFNFSPVVAYKISEQLAASVGMTYSYSDVLIARKIPVAVPGVGQFPDADIKMEGDGSAFGFNAGILYKPTNDISFGLSFHSEIEYDYEGEAVATVSTSIPEPIRSGVIQQLPKGAISAPLTTPMVLTFGTAYKASECLLVSADFQYNAWSSFEQLAINFTESNTTSVSERDYENSFIIRGGAEYTLNDTWTLRGGLLYDKNPVKDERVDPLLPDADRIGLNAGLSYKIMDNLSVDLAYLYLIFSDRTITNSQEVLIPVLPAGAQNPQLNGTYKSSAHLIGLNLSYSF